MKVLLLGPYGLIGREIARELVQAGHEVAGLARSREEARTVPGLSHFHAADIAALKSPEAWGPYLAGVEAVINASGALQSGPRDALGDLQRDAIIALALAAQTRGIRKFVQISAPGASPSAATEFLSTKGEADAALTQTSLDWTILKPGLVLSPQAYGGTALVRALAAFPLVQPIVLADAPVQTVSVGDVARAAVRALHDPALTRGTFDLVEEEAHSLLDLTCAIRQWLAFAPPLAVVRLPSFVATLVGLAADASGYLGWRAPLRSTALAIMAGGVCGDGGPWRTATGEVLSSLSQTLAALPSTRQERSFARLALIFPLAVIAFALFWIASGVIGLAKFHDAAGLISGKTSETVAAVSVAAGSIADIAIGLLLLVRRSFRGACLAAALLSMAYLIGAAVLLPGLWADPLGPAMKVIPIIVLALVLASFAEER